MIRKLTPAEENLLELLISRASIRLAPNWKKDLLAMPMNEAETGGLYLFPNGNTSRNRPFGKEVAELEFKDKDGINVIATLNLDTNGNLLELDIWKADFSPLIQLPPLPDK